MSKAIEIKMKPRERARVAATLLIERAFTYAEIADELGYDTATSARRAIRNYMAERADPDVDTWRDVQVTQTLNNMRRLYEELCLDHVVVQFGKIVLDQAGKPLHDSGAIVSILRELRQQGAELARLKGTYAPQRIIEIEVPTDLVLQAADEIIQRGKRMQQDMVARGILREDEVVDVDSWIEGEIERELREPPSR